MSNQKPNQQKPNQQNQGQKSESDRKAELRKAVKEDMPNKGEGNENTEYSGGGYSHALFSGADQLPALKEPGFFLE